MHRRTTHSPHHPWAQQWTLLSRARAVWAKQAPLRQHRCNFCGHRKVKCDRQQPCSNCASATVACVYPAGPGRAPKKPRGGLDPELVERVSRLESIIRSLKAQAKSGRLNEKPNVSKSPTSSQGGSIDRELGRLVIDDTRSYYVSNILWANLTNEIEELQNMLHEPATEDMERGVTEASTSTGVSSLGSNASFLGFRALAHSLLGFHPPIPQSVALLRIFRENVVPLVHIFHMPTTVHLYWDAIASLDSLDKNTEALLFTIYYSAIISMESEQCLSTLGISKEAGLEKYRFVVEQAMARADLLNTQSIILLQAAVIYLSALRNEDDSRTTWSLTSLVFHIAQAMGLHRDGTAFGLKPLETEVRRRLWYYICLLDVRSSEYHGYEPIAHASRFDTKLPLHVNDSDLTLGMTEPPPERDEAIEMTFFLIRCEGMRAGRKVDSTSLSVTPPGTAGHSVIEAVPLESREKMVEDLKQRLQSRYLCHCDTSVPLMLVASTVARLIVARTWLKVHYPLSRMETLDASMRDRLFLTSIEVLDLSSLLLTHPPISKWAWHSQTHIQWHAVAFVLSEICSRPSSHDCDRAFEHVTAVYDRWARKEREKKGVMWRPIRSLMAKANTYTFWAKRGFLIVDRGKVPEH
ncbi:hypothetical protein CONLIGDRAFT_651873 [Coniochaeta ligniaria NRRL 30616]|uniref:Zn(2)-C6 fungal-type domain-containing protein n=1 Tax=Coniochaeta ligniaria NRRL 30616 TaxID=1408157 RepID=A0A1J7J094_9PEZI|nr:hypothetical protein CONLIGDRAFT_651873 [Coniochaeta ligniaria NRRL 30616]